MTLIALPNKLELAISEIRQVPYWEVEALWPTVQPMLQKAIDTNDEWTTESIYKLLVTPGNTQLWHCPGKFALVTQISVYPTGIKKCLLFLCGGEDLEAIKHAQKAVEHWAIKYLGCNKLMIFGRRGWLKSLDGYKEVNTVMEKQL